MPQTRTLWARRNAVPWTVVWEIGKGLWENARDRVEETLSQRERREFAGIVRRARGRPWNVDKEERRRFVILVKKATAGDEHASWEAVGRSLVTLLPPRMLTAIWERRRSVSASVGKR